MGDSIKNLNMEMKDAIMAPQFEVNKLATMMKVIIMVMGKISLEGGSSKHIREAKVPKPRPYRGERKA